MLSRTATPSAVSDNGPTLLVEEMEELDDAYQIREYELVSSPNDFNISTIFNFIESRAVVIPGFQRNYVWDIKRASKLVESLILGLPIPQILLYEEHRNRFLVIDGQQRLMSIYYFIKGRFPRQGSRNELRRIFAENGGLNEDIINDDSHFVDFRLTLPKVNQDIPNRYSGLTYDTLGDVKSSFDLRTIRNVIVKQTAPSDDDSSIHEIFNRLNTAGINLSPQEIRASLYHSPFYAMLDRVNILPEWRRFLGLRQQDIHMKDVEVLLRGFAILTGGDSYRAQMVKFLDTFSRNAKAFSADEVNYFEELFESFLVATSDAPEDLFVGESKRFNIALFESVFTAMLQLSYRDEARNVPLVNVGLIRELEADEQFSKAMEVGTTNRSNVQIRLERAKAILTPGVGRLIQ